MNIDLRDIPTPQLRAIRQIIVAGVPSKAEAEISAFAEDTEHHCHSSPPKGYSKDKSSYGDSECYRYPLDTKARCLAAWRYVNQAENKNILGGKFSKVQSKIKSYAKKQYGLDLQVGESEEFDWMQTFMNYYDSETIGERCEGVVLEPDNSEEENNKMENTEKLSALEKDNETLKRDNESLKGERDTLASEKSTLEEKASQVDTLTEELRTQVEELESLREFKRVTEEAAEKAERVKVIKSMLEEAGVEYDVDTEADYWLGMPEDILKVTISKMGAMNKGAKASASMKVPQISNEDVDNVETVRQGLKSLKSGDK